jgi:hypothetical protein
MKINQLTFMLLSMISVSAFAGNYADKGDVPENNKDDGSHFYINIGAAEYYFNQPSAGLPLSTGYANITNVGNDPYTPYPTTPGDDYNSDNWAVSPSITLGYQFLTDNADLQKIFGQQNAIELRVSYFHNTGTQAENYNDQPYFVNNYLITGGDANFGWTGSFDMTDSSVSFDNTYEDIGLYYTGNKVINNALINSPYVGIDFSYLKQDTDYTTTQWFTQIDNDYKPQGPEMDGVGSDDLSSYYMGIVFGDKATWLFANHYGAYGQLGAGVYWMHSKLDASQTPVTNEDAREQIDPNMYPETLGTYNLSTTADTATFKLQAEVGVNYYFKNNQDPMSAYVTLLAGVDYWNDVAYADNPTEANQAVQIAYENAVNPYAGLQLHIPL